MDGASDSAELWRLTLEHSPIGMALVGLDGRLLMVNRALCNMLGYDADELSKLPLTVTESFAGVGNPHAIAAKPQGTTVVDIGCGAGTDLLLAAFHVGPQGRAIGVDMTAAMRDRARDGAIACGLSSVEVREGEATALPIEAESADVVMSNGLLNLVPEKRLAV